MPSLLARSWREPLVQFLVVGAVLFGLDRLLNPPEGGGAPIEVSPEVREALDRSWNDKKGRPPSEDERVAVLVRWVRNEALVREAERLGLDRGDAIIRRRLVQKMEFLVDGQVDVAEPSDDTLRAWFDERADDYVAAATTSFEHRFFSRSRRGDAARADAEAALAGLAQAGPDAAVASDPFAGPGSLTDATPARVGRGFGGQFAAEVAKAPAGVWTGPVASSFGWHLVYVTEQRPARPARFEERRDAVRADWGAQEEARQREAAIAEIVQRHAGDGL